MIKTLAYFFLTTYITTTPDTDCLMQKIFQNLNIELETKQNIITHKKQIDFDTNPSITSPLPSLLALSDFKSKANLEQILINFSTLPSTLQKSILECNLPKQNVLKRCKNMFPAGCEQIDEFTAAKKCKKNFISIGYSFCVPICPTGYDSIIDDPFFCSKSVSTQRVKSFEKMNFEVKSYRGAFEVGKCPEGFREIDNDVCVRMCPRGWEDFGVVCRKPVLERRRNEVFFYQFDYDSDREEEE